MHRELLFAVATAMVLLTGNARATEIDNTFLFLDNRLNDITFGAQGPRLQIEAGIFDPLGVPGNISGVTATHAVSGNSYALFFSPVGNFSTPTFGPYIRSRTINSFPVGDRTGSYVINVFNAQFEIIQDITHFLAAAEQLAVPSNIQFSGDLLAPMVEADPVSGADFYQLRIWDSDINRILNSSLSTIPSFTVPAAILATGQSYSVSVRGLDFDASGNLERRSAIFAPYVTPTQPSQGTISGVLDPQKPTIVITHGWQPTDAPTFWWETMADNIAGRQLSSDPSKTHGNAYNIVQFVWPDAFQGDNVRDREAFLRVRATVDNNGSALAKFLRQELGSDYDKTLHFIGHSFGTIVNAVAAQFLTSGGWTVDQFTILDAPLLTPYPDYPREYFREVLPAGSVLYVDNYVGGVVRGLKSFGANICSIFNKDCAYNTLLSDRDHSGVHEFYTQTINDSTIQDGFFYSEDGGGKAIRPNSPWDPDPEDTMFVALANPQIDAQWVQVGDVTIFVNEALLRVSSPAGIATSLFIPEFAEFISFDFAFDNALDGDFLSMFIDNTSLFSFLAGSAFEPGTFQNSGLLPIDVFAGGERKIVFWLQGDSGAELRIRNIVIRGRDGVLADLDIRPGDNPNSINPRSRGKIPVAILSTADFDAPFDVIQRSPTFGRTGEEDSLSFCAGEEDIDGDELPDLVCHFDTEDTGFQHGDTEGILRGELMDGRALLGRDSVRIVGKQKFGTELEAELELFNLPSVTVWDSQFEESEPPLR